MKGTLTLAALMLILASCGQKAETPRDEAVENSGVKATETTEAVLYGAEITEENAVPVAELAAQLHGKGSINTKISGTILQTCPKKGCWMTIDLGNEEELRVTFKDYGFFVPTSGAENKTAIMEGVAYYDTVTVDMLRHYAEDAGEPDSVINSYTKPEISLAFEATGVILKDNKK